MQAPTSCDDHGCGGPPDGQVKRFYTIFTEIRWCSSSMRNSSKSSGIGTVRGIDCGICLRVFSELNTVQHNEERLRRRKSTERIHRHAKEGTNNCETGPDVHGIDVFCRVLGQCRCQSAWMDGATLCSWLFACECAYVHLLYKIPTIWTIYDKTHAFFTK